MPYTYPEQLRILTNIDIELEPVLKYGKPGYRYEDVIGKSNKDLIYSKKKEKKLLLLDLSI